MNVLIIAYACEPLKGSEPGVGWNLSLALSKFHHVTVLTRRNNREAIEKYKKELSVENIEFLYHDFPNSMMWLKKIIGVQAYYILWNLTSRRVIKSFLKSKDIDIIHHVTFNQYRTPSVGYFINKPFVVGPVGGAEFISPVFDAELESSTLKREKYRRKGKDYSLFKWLGQRSKARKAYIFSAHENVEHLKKYINTDRDIIKTIPAIAIDKDDFNTLESKPVREGDFTMIYAGRALDWKGLHVFLQALAKIKANLTNAKCILIGIRTELERKKVDGWINILGINNKVELIDFMPRTELIKRLAEADLFVYPAFRDSGSMAVLEACALGCPSIVFDVGGQDAFPDDTILKVKITGSLGETVSKFSEALAWAMKNRNELSKYGARAKEFAFSRMTWEYKAKQITKVYNEIIK